ncbi:hypothetical protein PAMP_008787 [Pampus punctatissimus]
MLVFQDFSLVMEPQVSEKTLEGIQALIVNYKKKHEQLLEEQKELAVSRDNVQEMTNKCKQRSDKLKDQLRKDQQSYIDFIGKEKVKLKFLKDEEKELMKEIERVEAALKDQEAENILLKEQTDVFADVPEKKVVFTGQTGKVANAQQFEMNTHIVYPMQGGTALVTFEEEVVAKKILSMKSHQVDLTGDCSIVVEAQPVQLILPTLVEIDSEVCPWHILISNLPKMDTDTLLNKLEIHFSKSKNGGGEVDNCEMLPDSGTVVLKFMDKKVAKVLTDIEYHDVKLQQNKQHRVRVTPFLNGKITNLNTKMSMCSRTVLLTGIPAVMDPENLQDMMEIHFQKNGNGGGEIESFLYNPLGRQTSALFEGASSNREEDGQ